MTMRYENQTVMHSDTKDMSTSQDIAPLDNNTTEPQYAWAR